MWCEQSVFVGSFTTGIDVAEKFAKNNMNPNFNSFFQESMQFNHEFFSFKIINELKKKTFFSWNEIPDQLKVEQSNFHYILKKGRKNMRKIHNEIKNVYKS